MRILQLDLQGSRFEFHPYVSVLPQLSADQKALLLDVLRGLPTGSVPPATGLLEAHGVLLDLDRANLALLDLVETPGGHAASIDVVVRPDQLPGAGLPPAAREHANLASRRDALLNEVQNAQAAANRADFTLAAGKEALAALGVPVDPSGAVSLDAPRRAIEARRAERQGAEKVLADARAYVADAQQAYADAVTALEDARSRRAVLSRAVSDATVALESARSSRDPFAAAALDAAHERVRELEQEQGDTGTGAAGTGMTEYEISDRIVALEATRQSLEASLLSLDAIDPFPVEVALAQVENEGQVNELVPSAEAQAIADEWMTQAARLSSDQPGMVSDPAALLAARKRLDDARVAVFEAERSVRLPDITPEDAEALEDAHEQVLDAQDKLDKRFSGGKARQRLDEARLREQEILDRVGFLTHTDFVMGTSMLNVDPVKEEALDAARRELAAAEDDVSSLEEGVDAELVRAELRNQQKVLRMRAVELLGVDPGDDVEWALRQLRVPAKAGGGRFDRLRSALEAAGVALEGEEMPATLLVELANVWLAEQRDTAAQRNRIEADLAANEGELAAARASAADQAGVVADNAERRRRQQVRLEEAQSALREAEQRVERHAEAEIDVARARVEIERATADEEGYAAELARLEQAVVTAADVVHAREGAVSVAERGLAFATAAEQQAADELSSLQDQLEQAGNLTDHAELERSVADAAAAAEAALLEQERARAELAAVEARLADLPAPDADATQDASAEELEWYLMSRLAAQRWVSFAGSVPFVLDGALNGLPPESLEHLLEQLERMALAVQIIVLSDDAQIALWADNIGEDRAAIVEPERVA